MTRHKTLQCVHEPFGDAYYFGPERLAERYESDPAARKESGYAESTYRTIFDRIARENSEVRTFLDAELEFHMLSVFLLPFWRAGTNGQLPIIPSFSSFVVTCTFSCDTTFDVCLWRHRAS
jgi:hypothetical protein